MGVLYIKVDKIVCRLDCTLSIPFSFSTNLGLIAGGNVGQKPDGFLVDLLFGVVEKSREMRQRIAIEDHLRKRKKRRLSHFIV